ncbi:MAG TPA: hypothetical protein VGR95_04710 [Thermoanaerobaculia bacterium]|nr:hypothetical protein [Thermoanaerobaculia bacterium]
MRKLLMVGCMVVVWAGPQAFAQWTCNPCTTTSGNPALVYTTDTGAKVGVGDFSGAAFQSPNPRGPRAVFHSRQAADSNLQLFDSTNGFGAAEKGVLIDSVLDCCGGGVLAGLYYNASKHMFWTGNVGIHSITPAGPLEIDASSATAYNGADIDENTQVIIANTNLTANNTAGLSFDGGPGANNQSAYIESLFSRVNGSAAITFGTRDTAGTLAERVRIAEGGNVGIGMTNPAYTLDVNGTIHGTNVIAAYQDVAEWVPASGEMAAGTVVVLNHEKTNQVMPSSTAYDATVAGVVSAKPGIILGEGSPDKAQVATTGRVKVMVDATKEAVRIGDLLVTSNRPGMAMKSIPVNVAGVSMHRPGTIIGKALEPLESGTGEVLVLLSLQ